MLDLDRTPLKVDCYLVEIACELKHGRCIPAGRELTSKVARPGRLLSVVT
jgi:hypothetical protein